MTGIGDLTRAQRNSGSGATRDGQSDLVSIDHCLISMRKSIEQLESYGPLTRTLLEEKPAAGLVAERIMFFLVDLAAEINGLLARSMQASPRPTATASFMAAVDAGAIDAELVSRLAPGDGPLNVIIQLSLDATPELVEEIVADALSAFDVYTAQIAAWIGRQAGPASV